MNPKPTKTAASANTIAQAIFSTLTEFSSISITGQRTPSDPNYRVGVYTRDPYYGGGFHDTGFREEFRDGSNQVRHFAGWFAAGYLFGDYGRVKNQLYQQEGTSDPHDADVGLGLAAIEIGASFGGNRTALSRDIWNKVCGQSGEPPNP